MFLPHCERPSFTPIQNSRKDYTSVQFNLYVFGKQMAIQKILPLNSPGVLILAVYSNHTKLRWTMSRKLKDQWWQIYTNQNKTLVLFFQYSGATARSGPRALPPPTPSVLADKHSFILSTLA